MATQASINIWQDKQLGAAVMAAPFFWAALWWWETPSFDPSWPLAQPLRYLLPACVYPVLEEIVFRGGLQGWLLGNEWLRRNRFGISGANLVTSLVFATAHLWAHAIGWAIATIAPSLVFGYFRERHGSLVTPIALHVFYNAGYFLLFGA